ncbi:hypothetical protein C8Q76DRAFT_623714 [Earliella scabrosa]|nr:hypothetical protein C8Q76DRAFT_623714 [Earliella scabrosa]
MGTPDTCSLPTGSSSEFVVTHSLPAQSQPVVQSGHDKAASTIYSGAFHVDDEKEVGLLEEVPREQPTQRAPFYKSKWFIITSIVGALLGIAILFILLFPVVHAIAQHLINISVLNIDQAQIVDPTNNSFNLKIDAWVSRAGIIKATIKLNEPVQVAWVNGSGDHVPLGRFDLEPLYVRHKRAYINQTVAFTIEDEAAFARFTQDMITQPNFTWHLTSRKVDVRALALPTAHDLKFDKDVVMNGMNNFNGNVRLVDFQLPADDPAGGIQFEAVTGLDNPSAFNVNLGTVVFDLSYKGLYLGTGSGPNTVVQPGANNVTLKGTLVPQNGTENLAKTSEVFTQYLNGENSDVLATGKSSVQSDGTTISWLSAGLTALELQVPFKAPGAISPIKAISIGDMALAFSEQDPWAPISNSRTVQARMELPFGFNLAIGEIQNEFNITTREGVVAGLATPSSASTSEIKVINSTFTEGTIDISIVDTALNCLDPSYPVFSAFNRNLTSQETMPFQLEGHARAIANMSIGQITLDPIKFNVTSGLDGLQGLKKLVQIGNTDVMGGSSDAIQLGIDVSIVNPSNLKLNTGDMTLQLFRGGALIGTTLLPNPTLEMGNNSLVAQGSFRPNDTPEGLQTLNDFVGGNDVEIVIAGYNHSTKVTSLLEAFKSLNISTNLPALKTKLLNSASLEVLETTGHENNIAHAVVSLANPFTSDLEITRVRSNVTFHGITLGTIDQAVTFASAGNSTTDSPDLNLDMNMDPEALFTVARILAGEAGLNTDPIDAIVELGGYQYIADVNGRKKREIMERQQNLFSGFDLPSYVDTAFGKLSSDVHLLADVNIGDYPTTLTYVQPDVQTKTDKSLHLLLPILAQPIVQKIVSGSVLGIETVVIKDIKENSFVTSLKGSITDAGPFDATISFPAGLSIEWNGGALGSIKMPDIDVVGNVGGSFEVEATFDVADVGHLTEFTKTMLTEESFEWVISGKNLSVAAIGISVPQIELNDKKVSLKGMNSLKGGVKIESFDLPSNDPAGGIHLTLETTVTNPSQVGVELTSIAFANFFQNVNIGPAATSKTFNLSPLTTIPLPLTGRLVPQSSQSGLDAVSAMFNAFIHGKDSDILVQGQSAGPTDVSWLNEGIKALKVKTVLPNRGALEIIKSIQLNELDLRFSESTAFRPAMGSDDTIAAFSLPFDFPVDIVALEQNITVGADGTDFAQLVIPTGPSETDVETRVIHLSFSKVPFAAFGSQHGAFEQFLSETATSKNVSVSLKGAANTDAQTAVGLLNLQDIQFDVHTTIAGLQGLDAEPSIVTSLDVNRGFPNFLLIKVTSSLFNPGNITLGSGDVSFGLLFQNDVIGTADLDNLVILPGNETYAIDVHYQPKGGAVASGQKMLENYLQGIDSSTTIQGSTDSTYVESLQRAMSNIRISPVQIPALHQNLITAASLVFPTDIAQTGLARTTFVLANPFTASINLLEVNAVATFHNLTLGKINHIDWRSNPIHAHGHSQITSPTLPFEFNLDPLTIIQLLFIGAQSNHVDLGPLPALFQIVLANPGEKTSIKATIDTGKPPCVSGKQFDVTRVILNLLKNLEVTLDIESAVNIDEFPTNLSFRQSNVNATTDETALHLISVVAAPIVQQLVDQSELSFSAANITKISDDGFDLSLKGSLTGTGPFDAEISFVEPVTVTWQGRDIAQIALPPVCAAANDGVPNYETNARLTITDQSQFTEFATFLLHNPEFEWTISTNALRVTALGTHFDGVHLSKDISFKAFNNLPGVTISNFQLPSDDPAGGIHIETDSLIPSPAELGIDLGTVTFQSFFQGTNVGPLSGKNFFLAPETTTSLHLSGRITPKSGDDLDVMGELFTNYLHAENQTLTVQGESVQPSGSNGPVSWLSTAFKTLTLEVTLPGDRFDIITSIQISDLELEMTEQSHAFAPIAGTKHILAKYKNPFGFSLQVIRSAQDITLGFHGIDVAQLNLSSADAIGGVSTGDVADLELSFENQKLQSLDNTAFMTFFAAVTDSAGVEFDLKGTADVVARTAIGDVPIEAVPFDITTSLKGINAFNHAAGLSDVKIIGSGHDSHGPYILSPLTATLQNPSNISLQTVDISLPVFRDGVMLGRAVIDPLNLVPGGTVAPTEFHYAPKDANDTEAQAFLTEFLQTDHEISLRVAGDSESSPFASLVPALDGISLDVTMRGKHRLGLNVPPIVTHINVFLGLSALGTNMITIDFDVSNPLDTDFEIAFAQVDAGVRGDTYVHVAHAFQGFVIPAHSTVNSGPVKDVLLVKGALQSIGLIAIHRFDVFAAATVNIGEYTIPWLHFTMSVPVDYH